jgi:putative salt-induced outer membrane protein YdiY
MTVCLAAVQLTTSILNGADAPADASKPPEPPPKPEWKSSAALGVSISSGSSDSTLITLDLLSAKKWERDEVSFGAGAGYGTSKAAGASETVQNIGYVRGFGQYNHLFSDRFYVYGRLEAGHDDIADIYYRVMVSPGAGYYVIKDQKFQLKGEVGPGYIWQKLGDEGADDYATIRFGEVFTWKISSGARLWQGVEYMPQVDDWGNYLLNAALGVEADLTKTISLRVVATDRYASQPAPDATNNEFQLVAGVAYKF